MILINNQYVSLKCIYAPFKFAFKKVKVLARNIKVVLHNLDTYNKIMLKHMKDPLWTCESILFIFKFGILLWIILSMYLSSAKP